MSHWCFSTSSLVSLRVQCSLLGLVAVAVPSGAQAPLDSLKQDRLAALEAVLAFHPALLANDARIAACGILAPDSVQGTPGLSAESMARVVMVNGPYPQAKCSALGFLHHGEPLVLVHGATSVDTTWGVGDLTGRFTNFTIEHLIGLEHSDFYAYGVQRRGSEWKVVSYSYLTTAYDTWGGLYQVLQDSTGKLVWGPGGPPPKRLN